MPFNLGKYTELNSFLKTKNVTLVAVSKFQPLEEIQKAYNAGIRDFGENYAQELCSKFPALPDDIRWHFIGHLQTNKVKYIAPFVYLIQSVDSANLLKEINKQAKKAGRIIKCLLQLHIAEETSKTGFNEDEILKINYADYPNIEICGMMGMATFTGNEEILKNEFSKLRETFLKAKPQFPQMQFLSMGMTDDYKTAISQGSTMVRVGSLLFGRRS